MSPLVPLLLLAACTRQVPPPPPAGAEAGVEVRYRFGAPTFDEGRRLLADIPAARWDPGLAAAAQELALALRDPGTRLTPTLTGLAEARSGFPGDARFGRQWNGGGYPSELVEEARSLAAQGEQLDVGLAARRFADGTVLWVLGAAPHRGDLDPLPRDLRLDEPVALRTSVPGDPELLLYVAPPVGEVETLGLVSGRRRWVDRFHVPGEYRLEVVAAGPVRGRVVHRFSLFVEETPPEVPSSPAGATPGEPADAREWLYETLDRRRSDVGLHPLARFEAFEPLAREHAERMAETGVLDHVIPGTTPGVAARAWQSFHPRAEHHEDVAVAATVADALEAAWQSPGHRRVLLCPDCTHVAIGVAREPVEGGLARVYVVWELLAFPQGPPRPIERPR